MPFNKSNLFAANAVKEIKDLEAVLETALEEIRAARGTDSEEQKTMREAVAKQYGQTVADSLNGEALKELYDQINKGNPTANRQMGGHKQVGVPNAKDYFS
ncbi:hypothetical protein [Vibrio alginolyticus]|uniref:hypothetical protein n=1 Tax=Vibrio alginolyticus TaxID=663 RepID=UPI00211A177A|nr:hypothetical protein [Vibrio alginolyticus]MCQ9090565.1 hypothetical protein [Vibrio alginolyticus]